ncbi:MAG: DUF1572 family protein [Saprospiraceae bacterium]
MDTKYLESVKKQFTYYKQLGDQTFAQLKKEDLFWQYNPESNSIAIIVKHLRGNMLSRWTDFLTTDGEKDFRDRDGEFEATIKTKAELIEKWEEGWKCLFDNINPLAKEQAAQLVYIRNMGHTVTEAINRQLAHYAYHVGQIVFLGRMIAGENWTSLSIPKGASKTYNQKKFAQPKRIAHFTDEFLEKK